jgi:hypothetical protein
MEGQVKGLFDWVTFLARSSKGRMNRIFDRCSGAPCGMPSKGWWIMKTSRTFLQLSSAYGIKRSLTTGGWPRLRAACAKSLLPLLIVILLTLAAPAANTTRDPASPVPTSWTDTPLELVQKLAVDGDVHAQLELAHRHVRGVGIPVNHQEAARLYREVAERSDAEKRLRGRAACLLGFCYGQGKGVVKDQAEAFSWFRRSAEDGFADGMLWAGHSLRFGIGINKDEAAAVQWLRKAADLDVAGAEFSLGECYALGQGVPKNNNEAAQWYLKAAEQGLSEAQERLGTASALGEGVPRDLVQAYRWLSLAAVRRGEECRKQRDSVEAMMTKEQIAVAERLAREFNRRPRSVF